jgi:hypothetical protein
VIGMGVREQYGVEPVQASPERLLPEIGCGVD